MEQMSCWGLSYFSKITESQCSVFTPFLKYEVKKCHYYLWYIILTLGNNFLSFLILMSYFILSSFMDKKSRTTNCLRCLCYHDNGLLPMKYIIQQCYCFIHSCPPTQNAVLSVLKEGTWEWRRTVTACYFSLTIVASLSITLHCMFLNYIL